MKKEEFLKGKGVFNIKNIMFIILSVLHSNMGIHPNKSG